MLALDSWPGERIDGNPCCFLPDACLPKNSRLPRFDLKGYGIPSSGLPVCLRGFSLNGWRLVCEEKGIRLVRGLCETPARKDGAMDYLALHVQRIRKVIEAWEPWEKLIREPHDKA